jgi:hypothetical protein
VAAGWGVGGARLAEILRGTNGTSRDRERRTPHRDLTGLNRRGPERRIP